MQRTSFKPLRRAAKIVNRCCYLQTLSIRNVKVSDANQAYPLRTNCATHLATGVYRFKLAAYLYASEKLTKYVINPYNRRMQYTGATDADDRLFGFSCSFPFTNAVLPVVSTFRLHGMRRLYVNMAWVNQFHDNVFLRINFIAFSLRDRL